MISPLKRQILQKMKANDNHLETIRQNERILLKVIKTLIWQGFRSFFCIPLQCFCNKNEKAYKKCLTFFEKGLI